MNAEDIRSVTFEQVRKGYRAEDVDDFLQQVAADLEQAEAERDQAMADSRAAVADRETLQAELAAAVAARQDAEDKMYILAEKVEEYRGQEDTLKTALINAQRMGETVVHEAKQKAEQMLREATGQTELLRQRAEREIEMEQQTLENLQGEVTRFKSTILNLYKQHIESLSALDPPVERAQEVLEENALAKKEPRAEEEMQAVPEAEPVLIPKEVPDEEPNEDEKDAKMDAPTKVLPDLGAARQAKMFEGVQIDEEKKL